MQPTVDAFKCQSNMQAKLESIFWKLRVTFRLHWNEKAILKLLDMQIKINSGSVVIFIENIFFNEEREKRRKRKEKGGCFILLLSMNYFSIKLRL